MDNTDDIKLNDIIQSYLKRTKCEKTLKLLQEGTTNDQMLEKFVEYLKKKENETDELDFEVNWDFEGNKREPKVC